MRPPSFPRPLVRRIEDMRFPLLALRAIEDARRALDDIERAAMRRAREMGASNADIADALGVTRQAVHYRMRRMGRASKADEVVDVRDDAAVRS